MPRRLVMRVLVIADTHIPDFANALPAPLERELARADLILHAGDVTSPAVLDALATYARVHVALGNNDGPAVRRWGAREVVRLDLAGVPTVLLHDTGPRAGRTRRLTSRFPHARLIVFGHSHIPVIERAGGVLLVNPGSPTWKRRQAFPTFVVLRIEHRRVRPVLRRIVPGAKTPDRSRVRSAPVRAGKDAKPLHKGVSER